MNVPEKRTRPPLSRFPEAKPCKPLDGQSGGDEETCSPEVLPSLPLVLPSVPALTRCHTVSAADKTTTLIILMVGDGLPFH